VEHSPKSAAALVRQNNKGYEERQPSFVERSPLEKMFVCGCRRRIANSSQRRAAQAFPFALTPPGSLLESLRAGVEMRGRARDFYLSVCSG